MSTYIPTYEAAIPDDPEAQRLVPNKNTGKEAPKLTTTQQLICGLLNFVVSGAIGGARI